MCTYYTLLTIVIKKIDIIQETIELASRESTDANSLSTQISDSEPRYSFFRYNHTLQESEQSPIVFIYSCPSTSKIKERMMYAASKSMFLNAVESEIGLTVTKRVQSIRTVLVTLSLMVV